MKEAVITKTFRGICEKCNSSFQRSVIISDKELLENPHFTDQEKAEKSASSTEITFCDKCTKEFIEWMREKGYLKTDCWCKHIEEYKKVGYR